MRLSHNNHLKQYFATESEAAVEVDGVLREPFAPGELGACLAPLGYGSLVGAGPMPAIAPAGDQTGRVMISTASRMRRLACSEGWDR